jgi:tripartite-type tricarboxylate transporter receptor subunit TctC
MKIPRRQFLQLAATGATLPAASRIARAQAYPTRPVRIVVGFNPGGSPDLTARLIGQWLSRRLGQQFIVENRTGGGGNIATEMVVKATPDGHTLLLVATSNAINATLCGNLNFNFIQDIAPVAGVVRVPNVMEVNVKVPANSVPEFIAYAKANPGKINFASAGIGSSPHVSGELFNMMTGIDMIHIPYGRASAQSDLLAGQVQVLFSPIPSAIGYIRAGNARALAVTTMTRSAALPEIPTVADFVPGYEASAWAGIGAPKNTPVEIIDMLNKEINAAFADSGFRARLADTGGMPLPGSATNFAKLIAEETKKWGMVVRALHIKAE